MATEETIVHCSTLRPGDVLRPINYFGYARYVVVDHDEEARRISTEPVGDAEHDLVFEYGRGAVWVVLTGHVLDVWLGAAS